jgi:hypothetical protein
VSGAEVPLARAVWALNAAEVPFMVAGSFASSAHGFPRTTQDLDLVIDPVDQAAVDRLVSTFEGAGQYVDRDAARDAFRRRTLFNVIDPATGWKVDLIVRKARAFSVSEFERRFPTVMLGVPVFLATAEDTVIAKLEWSRACGGSERQRRDVAGILATHDAALDLPYVERWVAELRLEDEWTTARALDA